MSANSPFRRPVPRYERPLDPTTNDVSRTQRYVDPSVLSGSNNNSSAPVRSNKYGINVAGGRFTREPTRDRERERELREQMRNGTSPSDAAERPDNSPNRSREDLPQRSRDREYRDRDRERDRDRYRERERGKERDLGSSDRQRYRERDRDATGNGDRDKERERAERRERERDRLERLREREILKERSKNERGPAPPDRTVSSQRQRNISPPSPPTALPPNPARAEPKDVVSETVQPTKDTITSMYVGSELNSLISPGFERKMQPELPSATTADTLRDSVVTDIDVPIPDSSLFNPINDSVPGRLNRKDSSPSELAPDTQAQSQSDFRLSVLLPSSLRKRTTPTSTPSSSRKGSVDQGPPEPEYRSRQPPPMSTGFNDSSSFSPSRRKPPPPMVPSKFNDANQSFTNPLSPTVTVQTASASPTSPPPLPPPPLDREDKFGLTKVIDDAIKSPVMGNDLFDEFTREISSLTSRERERERRPSEKSGGNDDEVRRQRINQRRDMFDKLEKSFDLSKFEIIDKSEDRDRNSPLDTPRSERELREKDDREGRDMGDRDRERRPYRERSNSNRLNADRERRPTLDATSNDLPDEQNIFRQGQLAQDGRNTRERGNFPPRTFTPPDRPTRDRPADEVSVSGRTDRSNRSNRSRLGIDKMDAMSVSSGGNSGRSSKPGLALDTADELLVELLVQQASVDAKAYKVLSADDVDSLKKEFRNISARIESLAKRLALESKIREAALSLSKLHANNSKLSKQAQEQILQANDKVDQIATELWKLTQRGADVERKILQHVAGVLNAAWAKTEAELTALRSSSSNLKSGSEIGDGPGSDRMNSKLLALEAQVKSLNSEAEVARRNEKLLADEIDSKIKVMSKLNATVDDLQSKLDVEQENIVDRDRTISSLRAELEESNRKLEYLQTKHGHQDNGSLTVSGRTRDRLRDFTSDSGVETNEDDAATVISDNAEEDQGAASASPSATGRLKTQLAAAQSRIAALETELRIAGGGSRSPDGGNSADYPDVRNAMNAGMREVIVEREKLKVQLENEIEKRKDLEIQLKESQVDVPKLRRMDTNDSNLDDSGRRLQRQLKEAIEDFDALKTQREEELSLLRQLYNDLPTPDSNVPTSLPRFSVDALISRVDRLKSDKESLVDRILDLQSKNESLNGKLDFLMRDSKSSGDVSLLQNELDDVRYNLRKTEQQLQDALSDLSKFQSDNKQLLSELDYSKNKETKLTNEISAVRDEYEALLKEQISSGQSLREQMNRSQSSSSEQLKVLESQLKAEYSRDKNALEARLREAEDLNDRLKLDLKSLENDFQESRKAVQELEGKLFDRERELKELDRETRDIDERYRSMKSDYDAVKLDLSQVKRRYEDQLEEKADLIERLKREIDAVKREAQESTSLYSTSKSQVESQIKDLRDKLEDRESELKRTERLLRDRDTDIREIEEKNRDLQTELSNLQSKFDRIQSQYERIEADRQAEEKSFEDKYQRLKSQLEEQIENLSSDLAEKTRALEKYRADSQDSETKISTIKSSYENQIESLKAELDDKSRQFDRVNTQYERLVSQREQDQKDFDDRFNKRMQQLNSEMNSQALNYENEIDEKKRKLRELEKQLNDLQRRYEDEISDYERELQSLQNNLDKQTGLVSQLEEKKNRDESELETLRSDLSRISRLKETEKLDYERRIEELNDKLGNSKDIDLGQVKDMEEKNSALELQLSETISKFQRREATLSDEIEMLLNREARLQDELNGILKEFDRLTLNFTDFDGERRKFQKTIDTQRDEIMSLKAKVEESQIDNLGSDNANPTVVNLRKEFRKILADIREEYQDALNKEIKERNEIESTMRQLKRDKEMEFYSKNTVAVQTMALYTERGI